ncbi:hypothetical protein AMAG_09510 [Allomyces macrogynus ATCC 38327]|uniref:F-box domain-containing protein n=1 Tax=Allomyces macrogynus (strain ATCC 38327) TaxID=578462 RepID=A0A0L0SQ80_ALLM3|nr:hypothetical protein AMAG_09510 [Allomyces macrogynus ATCC 38327]|eukprot:KNE64495.1 hypothetical protein AMAG_09510 [Allomyces macrogynus ATCC 38327]
MMTTPTLTLHELPSDVLNVVCAWVNVKDREALVHFALAAPSIFAPAILATLRAPAASELPVRDLSEFGAEIVSSPAGDSFAFARPSGRYQAGSFATQVNADGTAVLDSTHHFQYFLLLPQRDVNRVLLSRGINTQPSPVASVTWSLVPIRGHSLLHYTTQLWITDPSRWRIPPLCRSLRIVGHAVNGVRVQASIPDTVSSLALDVCSLQMLSENKSFFGTLPRALRSLSIEVVGHFPDYCSALVPLLQHVPNSLCKLKIHLHGFDLAWPPCVPWLVKALPSLSHLESCTLLASSNPARLMDVVHALPCCPRLRHLALCVSVYDEVEYAECEQLAQILPPGLDRLQFDVNQSDRHDQDALVRPLKFALPPARLDLAVTIPDWHLEMGRTLPLAPTLTRLSLSTQSQGTAVLFDVIARLPRTLTTLILVAWQLHNTGVLAHLARHMPPRLQSLQLQRCDVAASDLADLVDHWPQSLTHLDLNLCDFDTLPIPLPPRLRALNLSCNDLDADVAPTWIVALPLTLRSLDLGLTNVVEELAPHLLAHLPPRSPHERIALGVRGKEISRDVLLQLKAAFFLLL